MARATARNTTEVGRCRGKVLHGSVCLKSLLYISKRRYLEREKRQDF